MKTSLIGDDRFRRAIYVVEDYQAIKYVGNDFMKAKAALRGPLNIEVWLDDEWIGQVDRNAQWVFRTRYHPDRQTPEQQGWGRRGNMLGLEQYFDLMKRLVYLCDSLDEEFNGVEIPSSAGVLLDDIREVLEQLDYELPEEYET